MNSQLKKLNIYKILIKQINISIAFINLFTVLVYNNLYLKIKLFFYIFSYGNYHIFIFIYLNFYN